ncbi:MAG: hypothetical protein K5924_01215 [Chloroflexi bacterium]|nr:hypothetical protein [Chloroflexota bacterium]
MFIFVGFLLFVFFLPAPWGILALATGILLEVGETIVAIRLLRRRAPSAGSEALIGAIGRTLGPCRPDGEVRVRGEVWRARCTAGAETDSRIRVVARDGATLVVEHEPEPYPEPAGR